MNHLQQRNSLNSAFLSIANDILIETTNNIVNTYDPSNETNTFIFNDNDEFYVPYNDSYNLTLETEPLNEINDLIVYTNETLINEKTFIFSLPSDSTNDISNLFTNKTKVSIKYEMNELPLNDDNDEIIIDTGGVGGGNVNRPTKTAPTINETKDSNNFSWVDKNKLPPLTDQGSCDNCWAHVWRTFIYNIVLIYGEKNKNWQYWSHFPNYIKKIVEIFGDTHTSGSSNWQQGKINDINNKSIVDIIYGGLLTEVMIL